MDYPKEVFPQWAGGEPTETGTFTGHAQEFPTHPAGAWSTTAQRSGHVHGAGRYSFYDGGPGTYIQAHGESWSPWSEHAADFSAWIWLGRRATGKLVETGSRKRRPPRLVSVCIDTVTARLDVAAKASRRRLPADERRAAWWRLAVARQLRQIRGGSPRRSALDASKPLRLDMVPAGDLGLVIERAGDGIRGLDLYDRPRPAGWPAAPLPLFSVTCATRSRRRR